MKNEKETGPEENQEKETKQKKKKLGKIQHVYRLKQKGLSVKEISQKLGINERLVRSYIWRASNPQKYKELLKRYFAKKKEKTEIQSKEKPESA